MHTLGFIGMGNMAKAIAEGIIKSGKMSGKDIYAYAPHQDKLKKNAEAIQKSGGASLAGFCRRKPSICWSGRLSGKCVSDTDSRMDMFLPHEVRSATCEMSSLS